MFRQALLTLCHTLIPGSVRTAVGVLTLRESLIPCGIGTAVIVLPLCHTLAPCGIGAAVGVLLIVAGVRHGVAGERILVIPVVNEFLVIEFFFPEGKFQIIAVNLQITLIVSVFDTDQLRKFSLRSLEEGKHLVDFAVVVQFIHLLLDVNAELNTGGVDVLPVSGGGVCDRGYLRSADPAVTALCRLVQSLIVCSEGFIPADLRLLFVKLLIGGRLRFRQSVDALLYRAVNARLRFLLCGGKLLFDIAFQRGRVLPLKTVISACPGVSASGLRGNGGLCRLSAGAGLLYRNRL